MTASPISPRSSTQAAQHEIMNFYQRYTGLVGPETLNLYLERAKKVKQGNLSDAIGYAKLMVKGIEGITSPFSPKSTIDTNAKPFLQRAPDSILKNIAEFLGPEDFTSLRATSSTVCNALKHPTTGKVTAYHVTEKAITEENTMFSLDPMCIQSLRFTTTVDPQIMEEDQYMEQPNDFPNCRTVVWRPDVSVAPKQGDYVESIFFSIQGMDGLYMRLYPNGKERSKPGYCSVYVGSCGTDKDVMLKVRIGQHSHIIAQKLSGDYVDGFVNFCPIDFSGDEGNKKGNFEVAIDVLHGPNDEHLEAMAVTVPVHGDIANWSIPRMSKKTIESFSMGDRITSDTFNLPGMGDESCFVIYPKGDTVDAISSVGDYVNVGLFGSSDTDVTFRLSAGQVSKVLTACCDRYKTKDIGKTKSCGEFFDACFATIDQLVDFKTERLNMKLEVLDTMAKHHMSTFAGTTSWEIVGIDQMLTLLVPGEKLYSRYVHLPNAKGIFLNFAFAYDRAAREITFEVFCINGTKTEEIALDLDFGFKFGCDLQSLGYDVGKTQMHKEARSCTFKGLRDSTVFTFKQESHIPFRMFHADMKTVNVSFVNPTRRHMTTRSSESKNVLGDAKMS